MAAVAERVSWSEAFAFGTRASGHDARREKLVTELQAKLNGIQEHMEPGRSNAKNVRQETLHVRKLWQRRERRLLRAKMLVIKEQFRRVGAILWLILKFKVLPRTGGTG